MAHENVAQVVTCLVQSPGPEIISVNVHQNAEHAYRGLCVDYIIHELRECAFIFFKVGLRVGNVCLTKSCCRGGISLNETCG